MCAAVRRLRHSRLAAASSGGPPGSAAQTRRPHAAEALQPELLVMVIREPLASVSFQGQDVALECQTSFGRSGFHMFGHLLALLVIA